MGLYYQPAHRMPSGGVRTFLAGGLVAAAFLAFVYTLVMWYWPFTGFFLFLGFGLALGLTLKALARRGKLRSPLGVGRLALGVGLLAMYLQWSVYLTLRASAETHPARSIIRNQARFSPAKWASLVVEPGEMLARMSRLDALSVDDTPLSSGLFLAMFWAAEVLAVVGIAHMLAVEQAKAPFSEATDAWALTDLLPRPVSHVSDVVPLRMALEAGHLAALVPMPTRADVHQLQGRAPGNFMQLKLHYAPDDPGFHFLTVQRFTGKRRKEVASFDIDFVVKYLSLSPVAYEALKTRFGTLPSADELA